MRAVLSPGRRILSSHEMPVVGRDDGMVVERDLFVHRTVGGNTSQCVSSTWVNLASASADP